MNLESLTRSVTGIASETGDFIRNQAGLINQDDIHTKTANNFVTYVDRESERQIVEKLSRLLPGSGFIAEENPQFNRQELTWIIDPLDGTTNFIHNIPLYCISIGLMENDTMILGVIYEVVRQEMFYTWRSAPSYLNGRIIRVSESKDIAGSFFATGFPFYDYKWLDKYLELFKYLMQNSQGVRRLGSAAADLAWVACGRFDGFYEYGLSPWDVAAGALLVQNAGGRVTDFSGGGNYIFGEEILATNTSIHDDFLSHFTPWKG